MTRLACLLALLLLQPAMTNAQSGVLIGLAHRAEGVDQAPQQTDSFETIWLTHDGPGRAHVAARVPALIVPRQDGFWRIGVTNICERVEGISEYDGHVLWTVKTGAVPSIEQKTPCTGKATLSDGSFVRLQRKNLDCLRGGYSSVHLTFVSPDYISMTEHSGPYPICEERSWSWRDSASVVRFDREQIPFESIGDTAHSAYEAAIQRATAQLHQDGFELCDLPEVGEIKPTFGWFIIRGEGRWHANTLVQPGNAACQYEDEIRMPLPRSFTGYDSLTVSWAEINQRVPDAIDAFSSPRGDMIVIVTKNDMQVFEVVQRSLGPKMVMLGDGDVVMVQWALGTNIERWTRTLVGLERRPLPEPQVRLKQ